MPRRHRGGIFWGVTLITAGLVALAIQQEVIPDTTLSEAARFWPIILIAVGVAVAFGATALGVAGTVVAGLVLGALIGAAITVGPTIGIGCTGDGPGSTDVIDHGTFTQAAAVDLTFNCATIEVTTADQAEWQFAAAGDNLDQITVDSAGGALTVDNGQSNNDGFALGQRQRLELTLPGGGYRSLDMQVNAAEATIDLADRSGDTAFDQVSVAGNAGSVNVDLQGAVADSVSVTMNAGSASILADDSTQVGTLTIAVNAGSVDFCVPDSVGLQVGVAENITFSQNLADAGLTQNGTTWQTPGFVDAAVQIHVELSGNAASFSLNPDGGCS